MVHFNYIQILKLRSINLVVHIACITIRDLMMKMFIQQICTVKRIASEFCSECEDSMV